MQIPNKLPKHQEPRSFHLYKGFYNMAIIQQMYYVVMLQMQS